MKKSSFNAHWDTAVKLITMMVSGILGYYLLGSIRTWTDFSDSAFFIGVILPLFLLGLGLVFMVTGYSVDAEGIVIRRLLWRRRIRRRDVENVAVVSPMAGRTLGVFGIWGFCGVSGFAYSNILGFHLVASSAYSNRIVISRIRGCSIVISPSDNDAFLKAYYDASLTAA